MTRSLEDCHLKLDRADELLEEIEAEVDRFLDRDPYEVVGRFFPGSDNKMHYVGTGKVNEQPPKRLRALIGDYLHNTRSALDNLADVLATPPGAEESPYLTEFPIFKDRDKFFKTNTKGVPDRGSGLYKMRGMAPGPQTMIKSVQPYRKISDPEQHPLWKLHQLNVGDKHRRPHLAGAVLQGTQISVHQCEDVDLQSLQSSFRFLTGPVKNGTTVQTATFTATGPNPTVDLDAGHSFGVAFGVKGVARGAPVILTLTQIRDYVRGKVMARLERFV